MADYNLVLFRPLQQVGGLYGRFSGPRGSWKGRGWDAEYKIMLHKNGLTVGKRLQENGLENNSIISNITWCI